MILDEDLLFLLGNGDYQRMLYDQAYLAADCDASVVPFNEQNSGDSSVATFATNYMITAASIIPGCMILRRTMKAMNGNNKQSRSTRDDDDDEQHNSNTTSDCGDAAAASISVGLFLIIQGLAYGAAGVGHHFSTELEEPLNQVMLRLVSFFSTLASFFLVKSVILYYRPFSSCGIPLRWAFYLVFLAVMVVGVVYVFSVGGFVVGVGGLVTGLTALVTHCLHYCKDDANINRRSDHGLKIFALLLLLIGAVIQAGLAPLCGYNAYEVCFEDCPLPAPHFNHNALFHIFALLAYALYGWGELRAPASQSVHILRRSSNVDDDDVDS